MKNLKWQFVVAAALLAALFWVSPAQAQDLQITEFMASNTATNATVGTRRGLLDEDRESSDWIEIFNAGTTTVNLGGWYLTDDDGNLTKWRFPATNLSARAFMIVFASEKDRRIPGGRLHTNFRLSVDGEYLALVRPDETIASEFTPNFPQQFPNVSYGAGSLNTNETLVSSNSLVRVQVPANGDEGLNWTALAYNDSGWSAGTNGVGFGTVAGLTTPIGGAMSNVNASVYIRIPFHVTELTNISLLTLRMRYDDGFVAFINGVELLRANAPAALAFNSAATNTHAPTIVEEFRLGAGLLQAGTNILAIQGLNRTAADGDFLVVAELGVIRPLTETVPLYFTVPTPGAPNAGGVALPGPAFVETTHVPNVPLDAQDLVVTALVMPSFSPVTNVVMRYRIMFNTETNVTMFDDGAHGDGAAGDGVYGATIPSGASTNGQMIRWSFRATDGQGNVSRWPLFTNAGPQTAEYLGTIVDPTNVTSKLPIIHIFAPPAVLGPGPTTTQTGADSQGGARLSIFHDGEFYDNVHMQLRGNSTAGFNKKSHRVEFNPEHPFRHSGPGGRLRNTSFVADYPDPAYMRQGLSFWLANQLGAPASFYEPVRLQLNGQFYQLANHNDVHGDEMLARLGFDPEGALYNAAGTVVPARFSTGGFEKKTREWEGDADYQALAAAVAESVSLGLRRTNVFEMFDVPEALNYLVVGRWVHENDDVWANMSLYHDNNGDGLWRIIPFDMNLSWGAIFYEGGTPAVIEGVQATNDIHKAHPLYGTSQTPALSGPSGANGYNRVYEAFFFVPQLREMYLRRMRTMMDTYIKPPGTPLNTTPVEQWVLARRDLIAEEANRDRAKWAWPPKGGQSNFDPGITFTNGVDQLLQRFFIPRRQHFYVKHSITNTALPIGTNKAQNAGIPLSQPNNAVVQIAAVEFNPASSNQAEEYIVLTNPMPYAVDISGWELSGGVQFTFHPGTVMASQSLMYLSPDVAAFRRRSSSPRGRQGLFIVGPYDGQLSARGESLALHDTAGRLVNTNNFPGNPSLPQQYLRITEIMYHPAAAPAGSPYTAEDFEYIELKNIGPVAVPLLGVHFTNGIEFSFTGTNAMTLEAGQSRVLVKNRAAFISRHGSSLNIAGEYVGSLDNAGETIQIDDVVGEKVLEARYNNSWYPVTDGYGLSLVIVDENAPFNTWDLKESWRPSNAFGGSPGQNDGTAHVFGTILVNEVLSHTDAPIVDAIELFNPTGTNVDIGGWFLSDDIAQLKKFRIPAGVSIPAGGYRVFTETNFNLGGANTNSFAISSTGDQIYIASGDANGELSGYLDGVDFSAAESGVSFGRYRTSTGGVHFVAQSAVTLGSTNAGPKVGPIVISEIMYHPPELSNLADNTEHEYIELHNISSTNVTLYHAGFPTNAWRLDDAVEFSFPTNASLAPGAFALVVSFDPQTNATALAAFRTRYGIPPAIQIFGPYDGKLDNSSDSVELRKPDAPEATGPDIGLVPYILAERVRYSDSAPWSAAADGVGPSLQRLSVTQYGNDAINWIGALPTPGAGFTAGTPPTVSISPATQTVIEGSPITLNSTTTGQNLGYQWRFNGANLPGTTNFILQIPAATLGDNGSYSLVVFSSGGAAVSSNATVTIVPLPVILSEPISQALRPGSNAVFSVAVSATPPIRYQWQFNGVDIPGATNAALTITNIQLPDDGVYTVRITDLVGTRMSAPATLTVLAAPTVIISPQPQEVVPGGTAVFAVLAAGREPLAYRWREGSTFLPGQTNAVLVITNVNLTDVTNYSVVITNIAGTRLTGPVALTLLDDNDSDRVADIYEAATGMNTNDASDAILDPDGDRMSNRDEYIAGTDRLDPGSYLKLNSILANGRTRVVSLEFNAVSNRTYSIVFTERLGGGPWSKLADVLPTGTNRPVTVTDEALRTSSARFYRIATPLLP